MKIKSIKKREKQFPTWDIDVDNVHHYIMENGVVSHNTSQILGNTESVEIISSNIYKRQTLSGEFFVINKYLIEDLIELKLWNDDIRNKIMLANGSIQDIPEIPADIKLLYKTVWETPQKIIIDMAADRGPYICQSQSMNLYFKDANVAKISSALMYAWEKGLKTLVYYTRNTAAREAIKFTVPVAEIKTEDKNVSDLVCSLDNPEACEACGS
jgi:ribonucleotide reductase alpha subunit